MPISPETLRTLGCTVSPEELERAINTIRPKDEDLELRAEMARLAEKPIAERFKEYRESHAISASTHNNSTEPVDPAEVLARLTAKERFKQFNKEHKKEQFVQRQRMLVKF